MGFEVRVIDFIYALHPQPPFYHHCALWFEALFLYLHKFEKEDFVLYTAGVGE